MDTYMVGGTVFLKHNFWLILYLQIVRYPTVSSGSIFLTYTDYNVLQPRVWHLNTYVLKSHCILNTWYFSNKFSTGTWMIRVKSWNFGHQVNSDTHLQTVEIQMRRLLMSRLIRIFTFCLVNLFFYSNNYNVTQTRSLSEFTWCPKLPNFTLDHNSHRFWYRSFEHICSTWILTHISIMPFLWDLDSVYTVSYRMF